MSRLVRLIAMCLVGGLAIVSSVSADEVSSTSQKNIGAHRKNSSHYPGGVEQSGVVVSVKRLDAEEMKAVFDVNFLEKGIQPLVIEIHNGSNRTYRFDKANVDVPHIPATQVAKYAYANPIVQALHFARGSISFIPFVVFRSISKTKWHRPTINQDIQADYVREEIHDANVQPNGSLAGFLFIKTEKLGSSLHVKLIELKDQGSLTFEIPIS